MRQQLIGQLRHIYSQAESSKCDEAIGVIGKLGTEFSFDIRQMRDRERLIGEVRNALYFAESPKHDIAEFELLDTGFCIEFDD